jgi:polyhydroxyalkanoate synthesis regulator phasin
MAETHRTESSRTMKVPEFIREPLVAAQARIEHLEEEAERVLKDLMDRGRASRKDIEQMMHRLSKQDWNFPEMKHRLEKLRVQGAERATEWRERAETFRAEALERMLELQNRAVTFLGVATRDQVEELSKELDRLARRIQKGEKARRGKKGGKGTDA